MPRLTLRILSGLQIHIDGKPVDDFGSRKTCALLVYLAVESGQLHQRTYLAGLLWPNWPEQTARTYLRQSLAKLRDILDDRASAAPYLSATRQTIQINPHSDYWLDVAELSSHLATATGPHRRAMTPDLARRLGEALDLYGGDFLEGFHLDACPEFGEWQLLTGEQFRRQVVEVLDRLVEWHRRQHDFTAALPCARRRVELEPLSEEGHRQYMRLLAQAGERSAALALYAQYRELMLDTLHTEPVQATTALADSIRSGEIGEEIGADSSPQVAVPPPFLQQTVARIPPPFVARQRELDQLTHHLTAALSDARQGRAVFVTGAAGQGKTALLHEFARRATAAHSDLLTVVGHSASHGGIGDPLLPFRHMLAQLTGDLRASWTAGLLDDAQVRRLWAAFPSTLDMLLTHAPDLAGAFVPEALLRQRIEGLPSAMAQPLLASLLAGETRARAPARQHSLFEQYTGLLNTIAGRATRCSSCSTTCTGPTRTRSRCSSTWATTWTVTVSLC